ncbi:unnamed protein product [Merluccius merluccius]
MAPRGHRTAIRPLSGTLQAVPLAPRDRDRSIWRPDEMDSRRVHHHHQHHHHKVHLSGSDSSGSGSGSPAASPSAAAAASAAANAFANDGSFMEMFKKKMEEEAEQRRRRKEEEEEEVGQGSTTDPQGQSAVEKKSLPATSFVGKRRGGVFLKTGMVAKKLKPDSVAEPGKSDAWAKYMAEVKKYKAHQCGDDDKTRPLVK